MKKIKVDKKKLRRTIAISILLVVLLIIFILKYDDVFETKKTYTVVNGYVENVSDSVGLLVKNESIVEFDTTKPIINIIEQYKRVSKNGIIAMYKDENYDNYLSQIGELDKTIETLIKDLPNVYSTEISNMNHQISAISKEATRNNSYIKIQEYKNKLDELSYKKVNLLGEYSPTGSKIRELIEQRKQVENSLTTSSNNVLAPISGAVTYKIDKLENMVDIDTLLKYGKGEIETLFSKYSQNHSSDYGIKIVDNYNAYFVLKTDVASNQNYIKEGNSYIIKTTEQDVYEFSGKLLKNITEDGYNYSIFKIENGIENIIDYRTIGLEVVWNKTEGLAVLNTGIKDSPDNRYKYVTLVYGGQYIDIPVKILNSDENISIVKNYTPEELKEMGIESNSKLSLYDIIVVQ